MNIEENDHDRLVRLEERLSIHKDAQEKTTELTTDNTEKIHTLNMWIETLRTNQQNLEQVHGQQIETLKTELHNRIDRMDAKFTVHQARTEERLQDLNNKMDTRMNNLEEHFDTGFNKLRQELIGILQNFQTILPKWARVGLYLLMAGVMILVGTVTVLKLF